MASLNDAVTEAVNSLGMSSDLIALIQIRDECVERIGNEHAALKAQLAAADAALNGTKPRKKRSDAGTTRPAKATATA